MVAAAIDSPDSEPGIPRRPRRGMGWGMGEDGDPPPYDSPHDCSLSTNPSPYPTLIPTTSPRGTVHLATDLGVGMSTLNKWITAHRDTDAGHEMILETASVDVANGSMMLDRLRTLLRGDRFEAKEKA